MGTSDKKIVPNKRTLIVASSLAAIPLATVLVATAIYRRRHKSLRTNSFLGQTKSTTGVITTANDRPELKEKSQGQQPSPWQVSETKAVTSTTATATAAAATTTTNNATITTKSTTATTPAAIPSPMMPSTTSDSAVIVSSHQTPKEQQMSVSDEARKAGESLKELIVTAVKEAKDSAKETGKRVKEQTINLATTVDSKDIRSLEDNVDALVNLFEETMTEIRKEHYDDQIKLLGSYKELLQTHIKILRARSRMASRLKPGA
jgi:hypothetical protein